MGQEASNSYGVDEIKDLESLFIQIAILLGASLIVFLFINIRNNKQKRNKFSFSTSPKTEAQNISNTLSNIVDLIPYATCIANEKQRIICSNSAFNAISGIKENNYKNTWDKYLKIDNKALNLTNTDQIIAHNADGQVLKISIKPLKIPEFSQPLYSIIIENVTHFETQTLNFKQRQDYFQTIISKSSLPIIMSDADGRIIEANNKAYELLETNESTLNNKLISTYLTEKKSLKLLTQLREDKLDNISEATVNILTDKRKEIPTELNIIPVDYIGTPAYFFVLKDISERILIEREIIKAKERAVESDRLKSSFLANMSHEVRTPLNSIMGFTELMSDELISHDERKEFHKIVKSSSNELLDLLNDIMEFSKIESGLIQLNNDNLHPHDIFNDLTDYAQQQISNNPNLRFVTNEPIGLQNAPSIRTDNKRVKQVLKHLIDNAVKFTYNGTITLSYQYRLDNTLEFIVSDTGIGIPQEKIPNIFHKFRQANDDNSRDFGGAGLGLSICKNLANALGGFLWVSSEEQHGSEFHFILPLENNEETPNGSAKTVVFYSKKPMAAPKPISNINYLALFNFTALLNVPLAHNVKAIILNEALSEQEMKLLMAIPQIQSLTIIIHNNNVSRVAYSPIIKEVDIEFGSTKELKKYLTKCSERELI